MVSRHFVANLKVPQIDDKFDKLDLIGEGTYGMVYKATRKGDQRPPKEKDMYALKCMKVMASGQNDGLSISACREIALLRELQHENIIQVQEVFLNHVTREVCFLFAFAEYDLLGIIQHHRLLQKSYDQRRQKGEAIPANKHLMPESLIKSVMSQLLKGILYLHSNWILHRDLKPANILVMDRNCREPGIVKIADLGMARLFNSPLKPLTKVDPVVVTFWYRSPELLLGAQHYTKAVDQWALGCIMAELTNNKPMFVAQKGELPKTPYHKEQLEVIFNKIGYPVKVSHTSSNPLEWQDIDHLPQYEQMIRDLGNSSKRKTNVRSSQLKGQFFGFHVDSKKMELMEKLMRMDPQRRITARQALAHPYFSSEPLPKDNVFEGIPDEDFAYKDRERVKPKETPRKRKPDAGPMTHPSGSAKR